MLKAKYAIMKVCESYNASVWAFKN